jgi:hypothetical protein
VIEYFSRPEIGSAVGPIFTSPSMVIVKWTPRKGFTG